MYDKTVEELHKDLLNNISDEYEKSTGFLTSDLTKSFAIQTELLYQALNGLIDKVDVDKLVGDELEKYVFQRKGLKRVKATKAIGTLEVEGNGLITIGSLFETSKGTQFEATEEKEIINNGTVNIQALIAGEDGNVGANSITLIPVTIQGITSVNNYLPTSEGYNAETDQALRDRYYLELQKPATSGNIYHYQLWAKEVAGVGRVKVVPLWDGNYTVLIVITNNQMLPPSTELINTVQEYIDPKGEYIDNKWTTWGNGLGEAPIGAYCTVSGAIGKNIDINLEIIKDPNYTDLEIKENIENSINEYFKEIAFVQTYISHAKLSSYILNSTGVIDVINLLINGSTSNIQLEDKEIPVLNGVVING